MKKNICIILLCISFLFLTACNNQTEQTPVSIKTSEMRTICNLATMDCYYHNVAKYKEENVSGFLWWKKDREFWIEYEGKVSVGVDASLIEIEVNDEKVKITMPNAEVLSCKVDEASLTEQSFIKASNSAKVEPEQQLQAFEEAQKKMEESAKEDTILLANAKERAKQLMEDYVINIGTLLEKNYTIEWVDIKNN